MDAEGELTEIVDAAVKEAEYWREGYLAKETQIKELVDQNESLVR